MRIPGSAIDDRLLEHRRRSTSAAGIVVGVLALGLFEYHLLVDHVFNWELLSIGLTFSVIKLFSMLYYVRNDDRKSARAQPRSRSAPPSGVASLAGTRIQLDQPARRASVRREG